MILFHEDDTFVTDQISMHIIFIKDIISCILHTNETSHINNAIEVFFD